MNCPGHMLLFGTQLRSYRELPLRYAESSTLHRNELGGTLHGLLRVRHVTQDDAHIFCTREQIQDEIFGCLDFAAYLYDLFGMEARVELSTRPENKLGTDEEWDFTEGALQAALERRGIDYVVGEGEGAFYGPKIDLHMKDALGRSWQMGTIQLDSQMPQRFGLTYMGAGQRRAHALRRSTARSRLARALHRDSDRALRAARSRSGSRRSRCALSRSARTTARPAHELRQRLDAEGFRVDVDERDETLGKRIRDAEVEKIPYTSSRATTSRTSRSRCASAAASSRRSSAFEELLERFRARACYGLVLKAGADTAPHLPGPRAREGSTEAVGRGKCGRCLQRFLSSMRRIQRAW